MYILLYSKYSRSCLNLLDNVDRLNSMMGSSIPMIQLICIDNKEIRNQILASKSIEIKKVPCLLIVNDTTVEKYDGERAFEWVSEIIQKMNTKAQSLLPPSPPPPPPQTMIEIETPQEVVKPPPKKNPPPPQKNRRGGGKTKKETKIEDLDDIEEEEEENDSEPPQKIKRPPIPNRNGAGSYIIEGNESEEKEEEDQEEKSTNSSSKGMGILDLAFAMRQEREKGK